MEKYSPKPDDLLMTFGNIIRKNREEKGLTLRDLGDLVGIDASYVCKFENDCNIRPAKEPVIRSLAIALDLNPEWLLLKCGKLPYKYQDFLKHNPDYFLALFEELEAKEK